MNATQYFVYAICNQCAFAVKPNTSAETAASQSMVFFYCMRSNRQ